MRPRHMAAMVALAGAVVASCATGSRFTLAGSSRVPAAQGQVKATIGENNNTRLDVEVRHLAPPGRIEAGATTFVVWAKPEQGTALNLGALSVDEKLSGTLETLTPLRSFELFVTAEPSRLQATPTGQPLLRTVVAMKGS